MSSIKNAKKHRPLKHTKPHPLNPPTHHDVTHGSILVSVSGDDNVDGFYDALEGLVEVLLFQLELK